MRQVKGNPLIKVDFHVHTVHSPDSVITLPLLVEACRDRDIDAVAIMDHDIIEGAFEFAAGAEELRSRGEWAPRILIGEEVRTSGGEICGLFLKDHVPKGLTPPETMRLIRSQGGLVYVPHPFDILKLKRLRARELEEFSPMIDIIEVFNGKPRFPAANILASRFLNTHEFPRGAGSDSHEPTHLGAVYVEMQEFDGPADLLEKLSAGVVRGRIYSPLSSALTRFKMRRASA
jgi:predicted metal-dependent phosphoesterase TrpH